MRRPTDIAADRSTEQPNVSRRAVVRTGAWSVPVVMVAVTAPAFAASAVIRGSQQVTRANANLATSTGTVDNQTATAQNVTVVFEWFCDDTGPGAGSFTDGYVPNQNGWTNARFMYVERNGSPTRGILLEVNRVVAARTSVPMPLVALEIEAAQVKGTSTATLSAPAPAVIVQPAVVAIPAFTGAAGAQPRKASIPSPGVLSLS